MQQLEKTNFVTNAQIELGEDTGKGKGRYFQSRFIEAGLAHYEELGDILITKETLNSFIHTMVGCPVIIDHKNITDKNVDKERVGVISKVWYNDHDGWFYCEGIITDSQAIDLIKNQGWSVSCAYSFVSDNLKKTYHGKEIDMEFTDGEFLHLAIVENPRYEGANIVVNNKSEKSGKWITYHPNGPDAEGRKLFIEDGQTFEEAFEKAFGKELGSKDKKQKEDKKEQSLIKDEAREADIALTMMQHDYEKRGNKGTVDRAKEIKEKIKKDEKLSEKDKKDIKTALETYKPKEDAKEKGEHNTESLLEQIIDRHYEDAFITKEYADDVSDLLGFKVTTSDIIKAIDANTPDNSDDYSTSKVAKDLIKLKSQKKKEDERIKKELTRDRVKYALKSMLKKEDPYADYRFDEETNTLEVRHWGKWEGDDGSGDYDWQTLSKESEEKIKKIEKEFKKEYGIDLYIEAGEKNWLLFRPEKKTKKANNSIDRKDNIIMSLFEDLEKFVENAVKKCKNKEEFEKEEVKNEDKRELIDEIGGMLKDKVDEELWRTIIGKVEKVAYKPSEDDKADNKCKNSEDEKEEDEKKKV